MPHGESEACAVLFLSNLGAQCTEAHLRALFPPVRKVQLGTKELRSGERRTAFLFFDDVHTAAHERRRMQSYTDGGQQRDPLAVHFSKRPQDRHYSAAAAAHLDHMIDHNGNPATHTLFLNHLPPDTTQDMVWQLFDSGSGVGRPRDVRVGDKELRSGESRTALVFFDTAQEAAAARSALLSQQEQQDSVTVGGRRIQVNFYTRGPRMAASYRQCSGGSGRGGGWGWRHRGGGYGGYRGGHRGRLRHGGSLRTQEQQQQQQQYVQLTNIQEVPRELQQPQ